MVKLEEHKQQTENSAIEKLPAPSKLYIPLSQHIGKPAAPMVSPGQEVLLAQKIADADAAITSPLHASVSGVVLAIEDYPHPTQGAACAISIENNGKDAMFEQTTPSAGEIKRLTPEGIRQAVREAGIVGMGGAGFPTQIKLTPPRKVDSFILNAAECEPYLTADYRLMVEKTGEILLGVELVLRCLGADNVYIAIEGNKPRAIKAFRALGDKRYRVSVLKSAYPQGGERQLIKNILKREVPSGKLPFEVGVVVHNVATVFAIYEAIYKNKPLYERTVTLSGDCLVSPRNLMARIGTPIKELIDYCSPLKQEPRKIIYGGPMMGVAQYTDKVAVTKTCSAIILLSKKAVQEYREDPCIRCGECVHNCPAGLSPCLISLAVERGNWQIAKSYYPLDCIECGLCAYLCPAKRNLVQSIKYAKLKAS